MEGKDLYGGAAYSPAGIALRVEEAGVAKARLPVLTTFTLGVLAGGYIGLGAMLCTLVASDPSLGFASGRLLGGLAFSLGLFLVVAAGAELFTGNNLLVMAWAGRRISALELLRNWGLVLSGNAVGAAGLALLVLLSGEAALNGGLAGEQAVRIARAKSALPFSEAFFKGVLCNLLVCLAVWTSLGARSLADRALAVVFPVTAFVACGFEHSVANLYFIPMGILLGGGDAAGLLRNLVPVTLGNLVGGAGMVGLVYWIVYRRAADRGRGGRAEGLLATR